MHMAMGEASLYPHLDYGIGVVLFRGSVPAQPDGLYLPVVLVLLHHRDSLLSLK